MFERHGGHEAPLDIIKSRSRHRPSDGHATGLRKTSGGQHGLWKLCNWRRYVWIELNWTEGTGSLFANRLYHLPMDGLFISAHLILFVLGRRTERKNSPLDTLG